jgi:DNA-directed RNA polymerase sigma subunit (sigma70/sigma32)
VALTRERIPKLRQLKKEITMLALNKPLGYDEDEELEDDFEDDELGDDDDLNDLDDDFADDDEEFEDDDLEDSWA